MPDMSPAQIVAALEEVRAGNVDPGRVSDLENYLVDLLSREGKEAVGALLMNLEGMRFLLVDAPQDLPSLVFRSDHEENALVIDAFSTEDLASISITAEEGEVPELPAGHQWFYGVWERLIDAAVDEPLALPEPDRTVYLIASLEADVSNGGFGQYLSNTDGQFVDETVEALESVDAKKAASYLRKAARLKRPDETWDDLWERAAKQLASLDGKLMEDDEYLAMMTARLFGKDQETD